MYPILFEIGPLVISSFGLMMVLAFLVSNHLIKKDIKKAGFDPSLGDDIIFRAAIGGIIGAKLYYIIENLSNGAGIENLKGLLDQSRGIDLWNLCDVIEDTLPPRIWILLNTDLLIFPDHQ